LFSNENTNSYLFFLHVSTPHHQHQHQHSLLSCCHLPRRWFRFIALLGVVFFTHSSNFKVIDPSIVATSSCRLTDAPLPSPPVVDPPLFYPPTPLTDRPFAAIYRRQPIFSIFRHRPTDPSSPPSVVDHRHRLNPVPTQQRQCPRGRAPGEAGFLPAKASLTGQLFIFILPSPDQVIPRGIARPGKQDSSLPFGNILFQLEQRSNTQQPRAGTIQQ